MGKATTKNQRAKFLEQNRNANGGVLRSDGDGRVLSEPQKSVKGQKANMNQAGVDHMTLKSKGGTNNNSNLQVLSKEENLKKKETMLDFNTAVLCTKGIALREDSILFVFHYEEDGIWEFKGSSSDNTDYCVLSLEEIIDIDQSILSILSMDKGFFAYRNSIIDKWVISPIQEID